MRADTIVLVNQVNGQTSASMAGNLAFGVQPATGSPTALKLAQIFGYSIQANYLSGSPAGTLKLQASIDGINFSDIVGTPETVSGTGTAVWNVTGSNYLYVQLVWTASGGSTGTLTALAYVRGF